MQTNEHVGSPSDYGEAYYDTYFGGRYERSEHWLTFFGNVADRIVTSLHPTETLDVGCAWGFLVEALAKRGVKASGFDFSDYAISMVDPSVADACSVRSATEPIAGRYDLVTCIEVIEHMTPLDGQMAIANMTQVTDTILVSSSPADFVEPTHINVQPPAYWAALFAEHGFVRDLSYDATYLTPWAALFRRRSVDVPMVVNEYETQLWRTRQEANDLRDETKRLWARLNELAGAGTEETEPGTGSVLQARYAEAAQRLDGLTQELWSVRDALEGALAARGSALGRLGVIEAEVSAMQLEHEEWEAKIAEMSSELQATTKELDEIKSSRAWALARTMTLTARTKRKLF